MKSSEYAKKMLEKIQEKKQGSVLSYEEFYRKMDNIAVLNQFKNNYNLYKKDYSKEVAFQYAKTKTYEDYFEYIIDVIETKKFSNFKNVRQIKVGLEMIKNEPQELYIYLDVSTYFDQKKMTK